MMWTVLRWGAGLVGAPLRNRLVPEWALWAFAVVQADVLVDWGALHRGLVALPVWAASLALGSFAAMQALSFRALVRELVLGEPLAVLRRQPAPDLVFGVAASLFLFIVAVPIGGAALLWYWDVGAALLWASMAAFPILFAAAARWRRWLGSLLVVGGIAAVAQAAPAWMWLLAIGMMAAQVPLLGRAVVTLGHEGDGRMARWSPRPRHALVTLVGRDLRALARAEQGLLWGLAAMAAGLGLVVFAVRVNNDLGGLPLVRAAIVGLAVTAPLALQGAGSASRRLSRQFDPAHWPIPVGLRAASIAATGAVLLAPSWAAAAVGGAGGLGVAEHARVALVVAALTAGIAWFVAIRPRKPDLAIYPWWAALCLGFGVVGPWWGPAMAGALGWGAFVMARRRLQRLRRAR